MRLVVASLLAALVGGCASGPRPAAPSRRLGDAMDEAGRRFHRAGRAVLASRWDLASYDLHELDEIFAEDLAGSSWLGKPQLAQLAQRFEAQSLPALRAAVKTRDRTAFESASREAARACNACHKTAEQSYIEISENLGADVPVIDANGSVAYDGH
jgi:hypothetical protein